MADITPNYGLKKPQEDDFYNVNDFNYNADIIDAELKKIDNKASDISPENIKFPDGQTIEEKFTEVDTELAAKETPTGAQSKADTAESNAKAYTDTKIGAIKVPVTSVNSKTGDVVLSASDVGAEPTINKKTGFNLDKSDSVTSTSSNVLATSLAVKTAYDKANAAFQSASDGKQAIAAAITGMGQSASGGDTFATLAGKIKNISKDANAGVGDVLIGKTFYQGGVKRTGTMPNKKYGVGDYIPVENVDMSQAEMGQLWSFAGNGVEAWSVGVDLDGNIYSGDEAGVLFKITASGGEVWRKSIGNYRIRGLCVTNNYLYASSSNLYKLKFSGEQVWSASVSNIAAIKVDSNGNVYIANDSVIQKYDLNGKRIREVNHGDSWVWDLALTEGKLYIAGELLQEYTIDCEKVREFPIDKRLSSVAADSNYLYTGDNYKVAKYSRTGGGVMWRKELASGYGTNGLEVDKSGFIYAGYGLYEGGRVTKLSPQGEIIWTFNEFEKYMNDIAIGTDGYKYGASADGTVRKINDVLRIKIIA